MPPKATWNQLGERQVAVIYGRGQIDNTLGETQAAVIIGRGQNDNTFREKTSCKLYSEGDKLRTLRACFHVFCSPTMNSVKLWQKGFYVQLIISQRI
jgi:hypothetical protein